MDGKKLSVKKYSTSPSQEEKATLKAEGYRWNGISQSWYKFGENGIAVHRLPRLQRSTIGQFTDPEYTRSEDAKLRMVYDQQVQAVREFSGEGPVFVYAVSEDQVYVATQEIPGAKEYASLQRAMR